MSAVKPILLGCEGPVITPEENRFFAKANPFGFILFKRNCENPQQLRALTASLREAVGREDVPVFIDQEGGRVARLKQPNWPSLPPLRHVGKLYEKDPALGRVAMHLHSLIIAHMLADVGINGNCAPVVDLLIDGASSAIGDRALSSNPKVVSACARVGLETFLQNGILPVIKHMPGHGRVQVDPHIDLPFVDTPLSVLEQEDFAPFIALRDAPIAMNCHVVFRALDAENPVSLSRGIHSTWIRGRLGFDGLIFSDDLAMGALRVKGDLPEIANNALRAGADIVLYCTGILSRMEEICATLDPISPNALVRWEKAKSVCSAATQPIDIGVALERLDRALTAWDLQV